MTETLLSPSNVLLFGRRVDDLKIVEPTILPARTIPVGLASTGAVTVANSVPPQIDGGRTKNGQLILLKNQTIAGENGVYRNVKKVFVKLNAPDLPNRSILYIRRGSSNRGKAFELDNTIGTVAAYTGESDKRHGPFAEERSGFPSQIEQQLLDGEGPSFARIYGFSFEGYFYELPRPAMFLVHGDGIPASQGRTGMFGSPRPARAPGDPSLTGLGSADFQFADDVMVWSYDKADYTIRMDVETGMFEQVLLDAMLGGGPGGMDASGMNARGMNARGMNARGMNARGMNARGMNARGGGNGD